MFIFVQLIKTHITYFILQIYMFYVKSNKKAFIGAFQKWRNQCSYGSITTDKLKGHIWFKSFFCKIRFLKYKLPFTYWTKVSTIDWVYFLTREKDRFFVLFYSFDRFKDFIFKLIIKNMLCIRTLSCHR